MARSTEGAGISNRKSERQASRGKHKSYHSNTFGNTAQRPINGLSPGTRTWLAGMQPQQR